MDRMHLSEKEREEKVLRKGKVQKPSGYKIETWKGKILGNQKEKSRNMVLRRKSS